MFQCDLMDFVRWYNPSQAYTVKHVSNPQLTATLYIQTKLDGILPWAGINRKLMETDYLIFYSVGTVRLITRRMFHVKGMCGDP